MTCHHTPRGLLRAHVARARSARFSLLKETSSHPSGAARRRRLKYIVCTWLRDARGCGWRVVGCSCRARRCCVKVPSAWSRWQGPGAPVHVSTRLVRLRRCSCKLCDEDTSLKLPNPAEPTHAAMPSPLPRGARRGAIGAIQQAGEAAAASSAEQASHRSTPTRAAGLAVAERRNACEGGCLSCRGLIC